MLSRSLLSQGDRVHAGGVGYPVGLSRWGHDGVTDPYPPSEAAVWPEGLVAPMASPRVGARGPAAPRASVLGESGVTLVRRQVAHLDNAAEGLLRHFVRHRVVVGAGGAAAHYERHHSPGQRGVCVPGDLGLPYLARALVQEVRALE